MPLIIKLLQSDSRPVYRQIVDQIRLRVASGELTIGERLPTVRALAIQLRINPNTVSKAYAELSTEGVIDARPGRGAFVGRPRPILNREEADRRLDAAVSVFVGEVLPLAIPADELLDRVHRALSELTPPISEHGQEAER